MAFSLHAFLLLTLLLALHSHARELQSFNKVSAVDTTAAATESGAGVTKVEPTFQPETDNAYGLDGRNPATTEQFSGVFNPHLPKNYNPVAYVTQPEDFKEPIGSDKENFHAVDESEELDENPRKYGYNEEGQGTNSHFNERHRYNFNNNGESDKPASLGGEFEGANSNYNDLHRYDFNNNGDSAKPTSLVGGSDLGDGYSSFSAGDSIPQGMSDTRALENGKYFYDVNTEKFNSNHPYEAMKQSFDENKYFPSNRRNYGQNSFPGAGYSTFWP